MSRRRPRPGAVAGSVPRALLAPALLGAGLILLPLAAMVLRVDPRRLPQLLGSPEALDALSLSLRTAAVSTVLCVLLGAPLALVLARARIPGLRLLRALVLLPLLLPPVVGGIALLLVFGRTGLLGGQLQALGISVAFSTAAVVIAQTFVSLPFLVVGLESALRAAGTRHEELAASLGAAPGTVLRRVTLPLALPGLASGAVLAFARSLGEFGATLTFAGSLQGVTRTLPLEIYLVRETDVQAAVALSLVLVAVALAVVGLTAPRLRGRAVRPAPDDDASPAAGSDPARTGLPWAGAALGASGPARALELSCRVVERGVEASLRVEAGRTLALTGPNGAGKSTLLAVAAGLLVPDRGQVVLGDRVLADLPDPAAGGPWRWTPAHRRGITLLAQRPLLLPHLSVLDNAAFGPRAQGLGRRAARERALRWLERVGAAELAERRPHQLSGGQAQRAALARALAAEPEVLLLDEPLAAVDAGSAERLRDLLARALEGRTAVLVTHDPRDAAALAHRTLRLERGRPVPAP